MTKTEAIAVVKEAAQAHITKSQEYVVLGVDYIAKVEQALAVLGTK